LQGDPFVEGDYYTGDLLIAVLRIKRQFWAQHPESRQTVNEIVQRAFARRQEFPDVEWDQLDQGLKVFETADVSEDR
jgi:hypothetical protein